MAIWKNNSGMEDFINLCIFTDKQLSKVIGRSIHPGAKIMANAIKQSINGIQVDDSKGSHHYKDKDGNTHNRFRTGPTSEQKKALIESFGIATIKRTRYGWNVKAGWDGYNGIYTKKYPKGQPNAMIARAVNVGTTFMRPQPFLDRAVKGAEAATLQAIADQFDIELDKIWNK